MDFDFTVAGIGGEPITVWDGNAVRSLPPVHLENFKTMLDVFGKRSAQAQGLAGPITDVYRLRSTDQRLYLYATRHAGNTLLLGGLKVGKKRLFVRVEDSSLREIEPTCVLDFYVHESCQRQGIGKELFEHFLAREGHSPAGVAYDRPSPKLLSFLHRHYGLHDYVPQNNNFVLFSAYWNIYPPPLNSSRRHPGHVLQGRSPQPLPVSKTQPLPLEHQHLGTVNLGVSLPSTSVQGLPAAAATQPLVPLDTQQPLQSPMSVHSPTGHHQGGAVASSVRNSMSLSSEDIRASRNLSTEHVPALQFGTSQVTQGSPSRLTPRGAPVPQHISYPSRKGDSLDLFTMEAAAHGMQASYSAPYSASPPQVAPPLLPGLRSSHHQPAGSQLQGMAYPRGQAAGGSPAYVHSATAAPQATISGSYLSNGYFDTQAAAPPGRQEKPGLPNQAGLLAGVAESSITPVAGRRKGMTPTHQQQQQGVSYPTPGSGSGPGHMTARAAALAARSGAGAASCFVW